MEWIGVDFDRTLAQYVNWDQHGLTLGPPIPEMVIRVQQWVGQGKDVRIVTARVSQVQEYDMMIMQRALLTRWCIEHIGVALPLTAEKDFHMIELWDDRAVRVRANEGLPCCDHWDPFERERPKLRPDVEFMRAAKRTFALTLYTARQLHAADFEPPTRREQVEANMSITDLAMLWLNNDAGAHMVVDTLCHQALTLAKAYDKAEMARYIDPPAMVACMHDEGVVYHEPGACIR